MQRIDHPTADADANGAGKPGYTGGDPVGMVPATIVTAEAMNALQEELALAIEQYEPLDLARNDQLAGILATHGPANSLLPLNNTWTGLNTYTQGVLAPQIGLTGEAIYVDGAGAPARRVKWTTLSMASGDGVGTAYDTTLGMNAVGLDPGATRCIPLESIVTDAQIAGVTALLYNNGPATTTMFLEVVAMTVNPMDGAMTPTVLYTTSVDVLTGNTGLISVAEFPTPWHTVDRAYFEYQVRVRASAGGHLRRVAIGIAHPGPRNW